MTDKERIKVVSNDVYINAVNNGMKRTTLEYAEAEWLIEQAEILHGSAGKHGYKEMYGKCNMDYATLHSEMKTLRNAISWGVSCAECSNQLADEWKLIDGSFLCVECSSEGCDDI